MGIGIPCHTDIRMAHYILHLRGTLKLMVYPDAHFLKLYIRHGQAAKLGNPQPSERPGEAPLE